MNVKILEKYFGYEFTFWQKLYLKSIIKAIELKDK